MTLLMTVVSHQGIWQLTDHLLTSGKIVISQASVKHVLIEASDGKAVLAYAGLGKVGTTPISEWVRKLLRGENRKIEHHLRVLTDAATKRLAPISQRAGIPHTFSIGAYKDGRPILYFVTNRLRIAGKERIGDHFAFQYLPLAEKRATIMVNYEGSGALAAPDKQLKKLLANVIKRRAGKATIVQDVTATLAYINKVVSKDRRTWNVAGEPTVSENCIVTCLPTPSAGAVGTFCGWDKKSQRPTLQNISGIHDVTGIMEAIGPTLIDTLTRMLDQVKKREPISETVDVDALNKLLKKYDFEPTDKLP